MDTFIKVQQSSDISGSVSVLHGTQFQSFRIGSEVYHVGVLPWWTRLTLWFMEVPWLAAVVVIILAFLIGYLDQAMAARQGPGAPQDGGD